MLSYNFSPNRLAVWGFFYIFAPCIPMHTHFYLLNRLSNRDPEKQNEQT